MSEAENRESEEFQKKDDQSPVGDSPKPRDPRLDAPTKTFVDSTQIVGTTIGRYRILSVLGDGGCGIVYLAQQDHPIKRRVALKVIKPGMDSKQVIARFEAERQALALLDHPNIAHVYDGGSTQTGLPYFVMEFVKGIPITQYCDQYKMEIPQRLELFILVCEAIHHAHQKGILHRDIKPTNILVSTETQQPIPKVIDFGVAKALGQPLTDKTLITQQGQFVGTPEYMSPEQANLTTEDVDTRSDIYSLGVVLYELLTGLLPFDSAMLRERGYDSIRMVLTNREPKTLSTRISDLGQSAESAALNRGTDLLTWTRCLRRELEWIPLKAMRKDRTRRYRSAIELADDIQNYLRGAPLLAGPETTTYRIRKFAHKYRAPLVAVSTIIILLVVGVLVSTTMYVRAQRALDALAQLEKSVASDQVLSRTQRLYTEGRYEDALKELGSQLNTENLGAKAHLLYAQILFEMGRLEEANKELNTLTTEPPQIAGAAHFLLARIALRSDPEAAETHKRIAEAMLPSTAEAFSLRAMSGSTPQEVLGWLSKALSLDPTHYPSRKARALAYYGLGDYERMMEDVGALISLRPRDYLGYSLRAIAHREVGRFQEAIEDHNTALGLCEARAEFPEILTQRRETYMRNRQFEKALADARQCVSLDQTEFGYRFTVFTALLALKEYSAAEGEFKKTVQANDDWHRSFEWWSQRYAFDLRRAGKELQFPEGVALRFPFFWMKQALDSYEILTKRGKRLQATGFGWRSCWSPDGRYIAYDRVPSFAWQGRSLAELAPAIAGSSGIEILDIQTGQTRLLVEFGTMPSWSPDGQYVAFAHNYFPYRPDPPGEIWLVETKGGKPRKLTSGWQPDWSRDSKRVFFRSFVEGTLCSIQIDNPNAVPVTLWECPGQYPGMFAVSPDDRYVAVENAHEIRIHDMSSGSQVDQFELPWPIWRSNLDWSPDGKKLIISPTAWYTRSGMWIYDLEQRSTVHVLAHPICQGIMAPDGSKIAVGVQDELWLFDGIAGKSLSEVLAPAVTYDQFLTGQVEQWTQLITADPSNAEALFWRALDYLGLKDYKNAETELTRFRESLTPEDKHLRFLATWWKWQYMKYNLAEGLKLLRGF